MRDREVTRRWRAEADRVLRAHAPHLAPEQRERAAREMVAAIVASAPGARVPTKQGYRTTLAFEAVARLVREGERRPGVLARLARCDRASVRRWLPELLGATQPSCPPTPSRLRA